MTTLAITGVGGFIGLRMAQRAMAMGWSVTGIDLLEAGVSRARSLGVKAERGDITDGVALKRLFAGADVVFHTAAVVQEDGPRELYERVNNGGTRSVCDAAREVGVPRLIHLSSVMVYGFDYPPLVGEQGPFDGSGNLYNETKLSSERIALSYNRPEQGFGVMVIRPGDVYGLGSIPWVHRPLDALKKGMFVLPDQGRGVINHVHVDNLIDGILLAFQKDCCGEAFNITDDAATPAREFFTHLAKMLGKRHLRTIPGWVLKGALSVADRLFPYLGRELPMKSAGIKFLQRHHKVSCAKARTQLGYQPVISLKDGMNRLEKELRQGGFL